jgi:hypothetical protein
MDTNNTPAPESAQPISIHSINSLICTGVNGAREFGSHHESRNHPLNFIDAHPNAEDVVPAPGDERKRTCRRVAQP